MAICARFCTLVFAGLVVAATVHASGGAEVELSRRLSQVRREPQNVRALIGLGAQYAIRASERGFPSDIEDARKYIRQALAIEPNSALGEAWLGAVRCIEAKVRASRSYANEGLLQIDHGVSMDPTNPLLKMLRGSVDVDLPREFNRLDQGLADLESVAADPVAARAADVDMGILHLKLAKGYRAKGDLLRAQQMWHQVIAESPQSFEADSARRLLR